MSDWIADFVNDPDSNFDLMAEILYKDKEIAMIRKVKGEYKLIVFQDCNEVQIPLQWLSGIINKLIKK